MAVYCEDCLYFISGERIQNNFGPPDYIKERCEAPENRKDTHKEAGAYKLSTPRVINRWNNCPWYIPRESSSSSAETSSSTSGGIESSSSTDQDISSSSSN